MVYSRKKVIEDLVLQHYRRRFHLLDVGSGNHPMADEWDYDMVTTLVEKDWDGHPTDFMVLKHSLTLEELVGLSRCEHFDVVLALNILHWFKDDWATAVEALMNLGDHVFIQVPLDGDPEFTPGNHLLPKMNEFLSTHSVMRWDCDYIEGQPSRPLYYIKNEFHHLTRAGIGMPDGSADTIISGDSFECWADTRKGRKTWIPGLNLWLYCNMGGVGKERVMRALHNFTLPAGHHGDIAPHNFVYDGEWVYLVDGFEGWEWDDEECLRNTIRKVEDKLNETTELGQRSTSLQSPVDQLGYTS